MKKIIRVRHMAISHASSDPTEPEVHYRQEGGTGIYITEDILEMRFESVPFRGRHLVRVETTNFIYVKV